MESNQKKEMDLIDVLRAVYKWLASVVRRCADALLRIVRLAYRHWLIVFGLGLLAMVAAIVYNRPSNRLYKVEGEANVVNRILARQVYQELEQCMVSPDSTLPNNLTNLLNIPYEEARALRRFKAYDMLGNKIHAYRADKKNYAFSIAAKDTTTYLKVNKLLLTFQTKRPQSVPMVEEHILNFMNSNKQLQDIYAIDLAQWQSKHDFINAQIALLDSVSRAYYDAQTVSMSKTLLSNGNILVGKQELTPMTYTIKDLYEQRHNLELEMQDNQTPVQLVDKFIIQAKPVHHVIFFPMGMLLMGLIGGIVISHMLENRKRWMGALKG